MAEAPPPDAGQAPLLLHSKGFCAWLEAADVSLALTTYQAGRLFFIGRRADGRIRAHERAIEHCQGLWTDGRSLWTSSRHAVWRFGAALPEGAVSETGADRLFVPLEARITGRLDIHDIAMGEVAGRIQPIFVNTLFNCLATISDTSSFAPLWRPPFISALAAEDRCHLNGLAMRHGKPAYVTAIAATDVLQGWRERRRDGGVVIEVTSGEIVGAGLSMPHSPRLHDGRLWLLNSGRGEFGTLDPESGVFTPVCACPGYARGLAFAGGYAVIGLSRPRAGDAFEGLELGERLAGGGASARCGLIVVDLQRGAIVEWLSFEHTVVELYDVCILPKVRQAEAVGFRAEDVERIITVGAAPDCQAKGDACKVIDIA